MRERYDIELHVDPSPITDFSHFEIYRSPELPIIAVATGTKKFTIEGKFGSWYDIGDELIVSLSTGNNGTYTVVSVLEVSGDTVITVAETIPSAIADGLIRQALLKQLAVKTSSTSFQDKGLPEGYFYYVVFAVDKNNNYSEPSDIILKSAPENLIPPGMPTGLTVKRTDDLLAMDIFWNANTETDLKGYILYRSFDGLLYEPIALLGPTSNSYKDNKIPAGMDTDSSTTPVIYAVSAINKSLVEGTPAGPTTPFPVPIVTGLRGIIDFLSINVYWDRNKPEDGIDSYDVIFRQLGTTTWILAGTATYPEFSFRIDGPLTKATTYEIGIIVRPHTGAIDYYQPLSVPISIPNYEADTTRPTSPEFLENDLDPQNNRMFMSWRRVGVDDDFLRFDVWWGKPCDIVDANPASKEFTIMGYQTDFFTDGEYLQVRGSSGNDSIYTIDTVTVSPFPQRTIIRVVQNIPSATPGGELFQLILDGTTTQNNWTYRNWRTYFSKDPVSLSFAITALNQPSRIFYIAGLWAYFFKTGSSFVVLGSTGNDKTYTVSSATNGASTTTIIVNESIPSAVADGTIYYTTPTTRAFIIAVTATDRTGNQSILKSTAYLTDYWMSQDMKGPAWIDVVRAINSGLFNEHNGTSMAVTPYAQFYIQWNDSGRNAKHFRRYVIFESIDLEPSTGAPVFDFSDESQIRGFTSDNTFTVQDNYTLRGFTTTDSERTIVAANPGAKTFYVSEDQRGHFRPGNSVIVYGSSGYDETYTIQSVSYSTPQTAIVVTGTVAAGAGGRIYDSILDKTKWYVVAAEDWFGDRYLGTPYKILEVK